jgi:Na+/H+ antiporter NhaC
MGGVACRTSVRTQKTQMMDKFKTNFLIVLPAAIVTVIILFFIPAGQIPINAKTNTAT